MPLYATVFVQLDRRAVHGELHAAEHQQVQAGGGDDHVGLQLGARRELEPLLGERLDAVGHDRRAARADRLEQVAVGHEAQALVPRVVARREVGVDVVAVAAGRSTPLRISPFISLRRAAAELEEAAWRAARSSSARSDRRPSRGSSGAAASAIGSRPGQRDDVARRALQHRHVRGAASAIAGHERHRGRAAADDDHPLAGVVEVLGPVLRVHDLAARSARCPRSRACSPRRSGSSRCR